MTPTHDTQSPFATVAVRQGRCWRGSPVRDEGVAGEVDVDLHGVGGPDAGNDVQGEGQ
jgi:hypothetical protein